MCSFRRKTNAIALFVVLVVLSTIAPREGRANSGFVETIGISTAVGTVLGASTLPFYSEPGDHMINLAIGAGVGLVTGLGIWVFNRMGSSSAEIRSESNENYSNSKPPQNELIAQVDRSHYTNVPYPKHPDRGAVWLPLMRVQLSP